MLLCSRHKKEELNKFLIYYNTNRRDIRLKKGSIIKDFLTYLTSSFLTHINYELAREDAVLDSIDIGVDNVRTRLKRVHQEIFQFFPNIKTNKFNLGHELFVNRLHRESYYHTSFEGFDIVFWGAIKDLLLLTKESRRKGVRT